MDEPRISMLDPVVDSGNTVFCGGFQRFQWVTIGNKLKGKKDSENSFYVAVKQETLERKR